MVQTVELHKSVYNAIKYHHASINSNVDFLDYVTTILSKKNVVIADTVEPMYQSLSGDVMSFNLPHSITLQGNPEKLLLNQLSEYDEASLSTSKLGSYIKELGLVIGSEKPVELLDIPADIINESSSINQLRTRIDNFRSILMIVFTFFVFSKMSFISVGFGTEYNLYANAVIGGIVMYLLATSLRKSATTAVVKFTIMGGAIGALVTQLNLLTTHQIYLYNMDYKFVVFYLAIVISVMHGYDMLMRWINLARGIDPDTDLTIKDVSSNVSLWRNGEQVSKVSSISFEKPFSRSESYNNLVSEQEITKI